MDTIADLLDILDKPDRVRQIIEDDLIEIKNEYGDDRRSEIDPTGDPNFNPRDLIPRREMVVTMTRDGYIKSQQLSDYQAQRRMRCLKAQEPPKDGRSLTRFRCLKVNALRLCCPSKILMTSITSSWLRPTVWSKRRV